MKITLTAILLLFLIGCAARHSGDETETARESQDSRAGLYKRKCIACHTPIKPTDHSDEEWSRIMEDHQDRLRLNKDDRIKLIEYLTENN